MNHYSELAFACVRTRFVLRYCSFHGCFRTPASEMASSTIPGNITGAMGSPTERALRTCTIRARTSRASNSHADTARAARNVPMRNDVHPGLGNLVPRKEWIHSSEGVGRRGGRCGSAGSFTQDG